MKYKDLMDDVIFKTILCTFSILSISIVLVICFSNNYMMCFKENCFNDLLVIFKLPINIFTGGMAIAGLRALIVRSQQTADQIELTFKQNLFTNYYKHLEEFEKYLESHIDDHIFFRSIREVHSYLFPESRMNGIIENNDYSKLVKESVENINISVKKLTSKIQSKRSIRQILSDMDKQLSELKTPLGINVHNSKHFKLCDDGIVNAVELGLWDQVYDRIYFVLNTIEMILDFEQSFKSNEPLKNKCNRYRTHIWAYNSVGTKYDIESAMARIDDVNKIMQSRA